MWGHNLQIDNLSRTRGGWPRLTFGHQGRVMNGSHVRNNIFLKGSTSRLAILPKRKLAMPEFTTYLRGSVEI